MAEKTAYFGAIFHSLGQGGNDYAYYHQGLLVVDGAGEIKFCGQADRFDLQSLGVDTQLINLSNRQLIIPGLIDLHVHLPQLRIRGRQADGLLSWLSRYVFSEEEKFSEPHYAKSVSDEFFGALLQHGTTTACVFLSSYSQACQIAFESALEHGNRVVMGLNLMDRNGPASLTRTTDELLTQSEAFYRQWHGKNQGRIQYAWMPRFALTSSEALLAGLGDLRHKYPDAYFHTHLSEQPDEVAAVCRQFPWARHYTHVYEKFGLLGPKTILAHAIHLAEAEMDCIAQTEAGLAHCPSSNFFLKSGRFPWQAVMQKNIRVGLGSDVGAGTDLSILKTMRDAQFMQCDWVVPLNTLFYAATLGAAKALHQEERLGNLLPGKQADFVILNLPSTLYEYDSAPEENRPIIETISTDFMESLLGDLIYRGDDRWVDQTVIAGETVYCAGKSAR